MFISFLVRSSLKILGLLCLILGPQNMDNFFIHFCRKLSWTAGKIVYCPYVKISSNFYSVDWNQFLDFAAYTQNRNPLTDPYNEQAFYTASRVGVKCGFSKIHTIFFFVSQRVVPNGALFYALCLKSGLIPGPFWIFTKRVCIPTSSCWEQKGECVLYSGDFRWRSGTKYGASTSLPANRGASTQLLLSPNAFGLMFLKM